MQHTVALFGEAEKGQFQTPYFLKELSQLVDCLGNPPPNSNGLYFAIQALLFQRALIYFRVEAEGFSDADYYRGMKYLTDANEVKKLHALCLPGVGDPLILDASRDVCFIHKSFLITTEKDLYDYLTSA